MAESATLKELKNYLLGKKFIKTATNYKAAEKSNYDDLAFVFPDCKTVIDKSGFLEYQWRVTIYYKDPNEEPDLTIEFKDASKKWFDLIAKTIEFYAK